jgi:peptidoglycan biosynthesis protein MviN/MurJ (putative lipid II flippase)
VTSATPVDAPESLAGGSDLSTPEGAVSDSLSVGLWTAVSRFTGVLRGITIAAVLGVTYFANTYQFTNNLPNLIFYGLLAGSLFSSLLVPALVQHIDSGDRRAVTRTAGGLLGMAMLGMLAIVPVFAVLTPWLLRLGAIGATDAAAAHGQVRIGAILVLLLLPQVPLYAVIGTATAVMNAHRRFALAAAAPAIENLGTIAVLGVTAALYSEAATKHDVPFPLLLLLGAGTTGAVMLHAGIQWWGARRLGVVLMPNAGWRDPQVRATIHRALPALAQAALGALQLGALLLVADRMAGGVVAFQLATNFYFLPIAIGATPVALSLVPRLSRMTSPSQAGLFRDTYVRGLVFAAFITIPAATAYAVLARPLAGAIGFGAFTASRGQELIAASFLGLAPAIAGETLFLVTTYACYARKDTTHPLRGMIIQSIVCAVGIAAVATQARGAVLLTGLGLAFSAGSITAASYLVHQLRRGLPRGGEPALRPFLRTAACSAIMIVPAWAGANLLVSHASNAAERVAAVLLVCVGGAVIYFSAQAAMRAPQMQWLTGAVLARWWRLAGHAPVSWRAAAFGPVLRRRRLDAFLLFGPLAAGMLAAINLKYAVAAMIAVGVIGWVTARPPIAAYLLIFLTPLIVGINAGSLVHTLRLNEVLIVLLGAGIGLRWLAGARTGELRWPRLDRVDASLIAIGITSSVLPLAMMMVRQRAITSDDLLYCIVMWKLLAEYAIVRTVISTREQATRCLVLLMVATAVVCVVGILQSLGVGAVTGLLGKFYAPVAVEATGGRGGSLLGLPAATADLAILSLAIAVAMIVRGYPHRVWLAGSAALCALGVVAAAEFSTLIGLMVAVVALMALTKSARLVAYAIPVALCGGILLWPVIALRLSGFHSASGLPVSWTGRLYNLHTFFWPVLFSDNNWILGVRPSARVATPTSVEGWVWIESGYTWLLWGGGIPLFASYLFFVGSVLQKGWAYARRADVAGVAATAVAAAVCAQVVLMLFDPHLTYRGSGDAFFWVLALVRSLPAQRGSPERRCRPAAAAVTAARPQEVPV